MTGKESNLKKLLSVVTAIAVALALLTGAAAVPTTVIASTYQK